MSNLHPYTLYIVLGSFIYQIELSVAEEFGTWELVSWYLIEVLRGVGVEVFCSHDLCGCLTEPSALLVKGGIDLDEMNTGQVRGCAVCFDCPLDIEL